MKTNAYTYPKLAPEYLTKIDRDAYLRRFIWFLFRRYCLNEDRYRITCRFTGPRPRGTNQVSTLKANATAFRYYLEPRSRRAAIRDYSRSAA